MQNQDSSLPIHSSTEINSNLVQFKVLESNKNDMDNNYSKELNHTSNKNTELTQFCIKSPHTYKLGYPSSPLSMITTNMITESSSSSSTMTTTINDITAFLDGSSFSKKRSVTHDDKLFTSYKKKPRILKADNCNLFSSRQLTMDDHDTLKALQQIPSMISIFDSIPANLKSRLLFQLLKRSSIDTLQFINSAIVPVLKHDLLSTLPLEISRYIISYLDAFSLSTASCVCKKWKSIIDTDDKVWKQLLIKDGYSLVNPLPSMNVSITTNYSYYKKLYAIHHTLRQNWRKGRAEERTFRGHEKFVVTCLQFDDDKIVSGADDAHVNIYSTATGKKRMTLEGHEGGVWALQYLDNTLVTGSTDRRVRVWDMETGKCTHIFNGHTSTVRCLLITKPIQGNDPSLIITGSRDSTLRIWRLPNPKDVEGHYFGDTSTKPNPYFVRALVGHGQSVRAIAAHGDTLVSGSYDHTVRVWNIRTGHTVHVLEGHTNRVYSVVIDSERNRCMSGSMDSSIRIWDLKTGDCIKKLEGHTVLVGLLGLSKNYLVSAAADSILRIWSPDTGVCQHALAGHANSITCFQHDNDKIISGSEGGLKMWDIKTGRFIRDLITDVDGIWRVVFDGRRCIAAIQKNNETSFKIFDFGVHRLSNYLI
ncbi:WD40-repeat-containing domain protein [Cokeromyces recurvatus]|uniref:WD40-repeat-containing domain protein n=1 Tax=Cokeromyces recurvatus TaxID=90255 RepID=UPI00221F31D1|nr:WD40-repeat-containing domain protein [Cokeromyces recurvatus]KAI7904020.1 WD40-repeat-containing domain protein [Cokeromyces recurvatus]